MASLEIVRISPTFYKKMKNFQIAYGFANTCFGKCLIGVHDNSLCYTSFFDNEDDIAWALENMKSDWPKCMLVNDELKVQSFVKRIFQREYGNLPLNVLLKGTDFQCQVWKELLNIQSGCTVSYEHIAKAIGRPGAVRGVANAIAKNKIAYVIPCHRVIRKNGVINKYRWGDSRKKVILGYESNLV